MSLAASPVIEHQFLYWGVLLSVPIAGGLWKSAKFRGDINQEWAPRVDILESGLTNRAVGVLSKLRRDIDELIGGAEQEFDPDSAIVDPVALLKSVRKFERLIAARRRARNLFRWLLQIGNVLLASLTLLLIANIAGSLHLSKLIDLSPYEGEVLAVGALGLGGLAASFCSYAYILQKLSGAEILADQDDGLDV